jgi:hypothetical protein
VLVTAEGANLTEIGIMRVAVIVPATAFTFVLGAARLRPLVAYFADVGAIHQQHQFAPFPESVFRSDTINQPVAPFDASRILSVVSDNVFVATIFITQVREAIVVGAINSSRNGAALLELGLPTMHVCHQWNRSLPLAAPHFIVAVSGLAADTRTGSDRAAENLACLGALTGGRLRMGVGRNQSEPITKTALIWAPRIHTLGTRRPAAV